MATHLVAKEHDLGGLTVRRVLPHMQKKMVGPFIFFDHMGPTEFAAGQGINVRPHPHIGLSTLTYLFTGSILHRDSLGNHLEIFPGDVNWMTAGKGIVHSERETFEVRANKHAIDGLQCWVALPEHMAELESSFQHVKKQLLPTLIREDIMMRLIVGEAYGMSAPIKTYSPMFYLDIAACAGSAIDLPDSQQETAVYVITGEIEIAGQVYTKGDFVLFDDESAFSFVQPGRVVLLGGDRFEKVPHITWNFVGYSKERINQAIEDWRAGKFPAVPDDNKEFIPF
ncbi:pirin family protein [Glaciecola sp. XM2]|uniref:pirin family protein n=1 Tax=Glaciecola sp. XM2 TaxID=1914931 RepID=UPI001BDDD882|nr:pirin family protein [Glaciecola sp. XM2]MBT1450815.1 pirin family protein [Glaciecola sp. XM2]